MLVLLVLLALAGPAAGVIWTMHRASQQDGAAREIELALAAVSPQRLATVELDAQMRAALAGRVGAVRWVGIVESDGSCTELMRDVDLPVEAIVAQLPPRALRPQVSALQNTSSPMSVYELATSPMNTGGGTIAAVIERSSAAGTPRLPQLPIAACGLVAIAGLIATLMWLRLVIIRPLEALGQRLTIPHSGLLPSLPILAVPDELEGVACTVESLARDVERWRVEAAFLRNSIESTVDARARSAEREADRARREADTDDLTKLRNRRYLDREFPRLFDESLKSGAELAALVIDVDRFKQLNDKRGHQSGDAVLVFVGELLASITRRGTDIAARFGGDEFVIILPGVDAENALAISQRIAALFGQRARTLGQIDPPPALSIGVAARKRHGAATSADLLRMADVAMYFAKRSGRGVSVVPTRPAIAAHRPRPTPGA